MCAIGQKQRQITTAAHWRVSWPRRAHSGALGVGRRGRRRACRCGGGRGAARSRAAGGAVLWGDLSVARLGARCRFGSRECAGWWRSLFIIGCIAHCNLITPGWCALTGNRGVRGLRLFTSGWLLGRRWVLCDLMGIWCLRSSPRLAGAAEVIVWITLAYISVFASARRFVPCCNMPDDLPRPRWWALTLIDGRGLWWIASVEFAPLAMVWPTLGCWADRVTSVWAMLHAVAW